MVYVPLDSWVYPALRRLGDFGLIPDQSSNLMPWTRQECLRQVREAAATETKLGSAKVVASRLIADLQRELERTETDRKAIRVESVYTRMTGIAGTPLRDSYHFGQTIANDFGRPYDKGLNNVSGVSAAAVLGRFSAYVRGEFAEAPGRGPDSPELSQFLAKLDGVPSLGNGAIPPVWRFDTLEAYLGVRFGIENITFGKQNLFWGPGEESAFSFSANAAPLEMLRFAQTQPFELPGFLRHLGKVRTDIVFGKLSGHQFPARPYMTAQKASIQVTKDLELGFTRSSFFGGVGHPLTLGALEATLFSVVSVDRGGYGLRSDLAGDRHSGFDFHWRVPGLRHYLSLYSDSYADDEPSPLDNPRRSAWAPGLYLTRLPKFPNLDFRFETYATWLYAKDFGGNFLYWNSQYRDSYTNNGVLLGSWIGRDSRAYISKLGYWVSGRSKLTAAYQQIKVGNEFLPGGGTQTDVSATLDWRITSEWQASGELQGERYYIPVLGSARKDVVVAIGFAFYPKDWILKSSPRF